MIRSPHPAARRAVRLTAATAALTFALSAAACQLDVDTSDAATTAPAARDAPQLAGTWRSVGYGWALEARGARIRMYDVTRSGCTPASVFRAHARGAAVRLTATDGWGALDAVAGRRAGSVVLRPVGSVGVVTLRRIRRPPARCDAAPHRDQRATTRALTETFAEQYPFFARRGVDWRRTTRALERATRTPLPPKQLFELYRRALAPLHDAHVSLLDPGSETEWTGRRPDPHPLAPADHARIQQIVETRLGARLRSFANGRIFYARTHSGIGYLRIVSFGGYARAAATADGSRRDAQVLARTLDGILGGADAPRSGLLVDVRENVGGYDALQLVVAARLTATRYLAFRKATQISGGRTPRRTRPQAIDVVPAAGRPGWHGPVALLTGRDTESAGETFVLSLIGRTPAVARIGETTQGVFSDQLVRRLPNGWTFGLPSEIYTAPDGTVYEGRGIPPTDAQPVFTPEDLATRRDPALERALSALGGR
ncbi:S41 family peptidase [Conexibacter woesei]|uniref:Peptidase S41 n=1 Tax=Conexibacter woesei (strain DSM 14684 / CCUG 47730 / CIP 108061 / JCM 11494 / NBRC 100937 / ID131577) TaxID=469383 RepID=D3F622_CONWI|nr:S41 family peptidase [Conexibacter woesei]ADB48695.1 peptidase S41 [Conexibacter woesei DSM 14684]